MIKELSSHGKIDSGNSFLEKFKGKVNKVSKQGLKQIILSQKTQVFQSFQQDKPLADFKKRRRSLSSGKLENFPALEQSSHPGSVEDKKIQKSTSLAQVKKKNSQNLPKLTSQKELQRKLSLQGRNRQKTKSELRVNKIIQTAALQSKSKYKSWKSPIDVSEDNLRFFKFSTGMSKLASRQSSEL